MSRLDTSPSTTAFPDIKGQCIRGFIDGSLVDLMNGSFVRICVHIICAICRKKPTRRFTKLFIMVSYLWFNAQYFINDTHKTLFQYNDSLAHGYEACCMDISNILRNKDIQTLQPDRKALWYNREILQRHENLLESSTKQQILRICFLIPSSSL